MLADLTHSRSSAYISSFVLAFGLVATAPVTAQILYGGIVGVVRDAQGAVVPGANGTIVDTGTNLTREATTDAQGSYNVVNVLAGPYDVRVVLRGSARRFGPTSP